MTPKTPTMTPAVWLILLALAERPRHGYGIRSEIEKLTKERTTMGSGTFYRSIQRMTINGWVRRLDHLSEASDEDERRVYYELTERGRRTAAAEASRLADLVAAAISRRLLPGWRIDRTGDTAAGMKDGGRKR